MHITEIKKAKKDPNRVHLYIDERYIGTIYIDFLVKYKIKTDGAIDKELLDEVITESNNLKLFNLCINYILRRLRSEKELKEYISKKTYTYKWDPLKVDTNGIINKLKDYKYINDEEFADSWVNSRIRKGIGPGRLRMELMMKGVDKNIIENIIYAIPEEDIESQKQKLSEKYLRSKRFKDDREKDWKLKQHLMSRGF